MTISEQLKAAIRASGQSVSEIARQSEISRANLSRFLSDDPDQHRDMLIERTVDRLAEYLGLTLVDAPKAPPKRTKGKKPASSTPRRRSR